MGEAAYLAIGFGDDDLQFAAAAAGVQVVDFIGAGADVGGVDRVGTAVGAALALSATAAKVAIAVGVGLTATSIGTSFVDNGGAQIASLVTGVVGGFLLGFGAGATVVKSAKPRVQFNKNGAITKTGLKDFDKLDGFKRPGMLKFDPPVSRGALHPGTSAASSSSPVAPSSKSLGTIVSKIRE